jgi:hypothetical protein
MNPTKSRKTAYRMAEATSEKRKVRQSTDSRRCKLGMLSVVNESVGSTKAEVYSRPPDEDADIMASGFAEDAGTYCDNSDCYLNIPKSEVVASDRATQRMEWKTKDGNVKHFCVSCARAVTLWLAEREHDAPRVDCAATPPTITVIGLKIDISKASPNGGAANDDIAT